MSGLTAPGQNSPVQATRTDRLTEIAYTRLRATLATSCFLHSCIDGALTSCLYSFLVWSREFSYRFPKLDSCGPDILARWPLFQVPAGFLAERWGEPRVLVADIAHGGRFSVPWRCGKFRFTSRFSCDRWPRVGTQHPLSSSLVSRAYEEGPRRTALGIFNFSGDLGKVTFPACVAFVTAWVGWRWAVQGMGLVVLATAVAMFFILASLAPNRGEGQASLAAGRTGDGWGIRNSRGFSLLSIIHGIDNGSRTVFLTYLPFLLLSKGAGMNLIGLALGLTFAGEQRGNSSAEFWPSGWHHPDGPRHRGRDGTGYPHAVGTARNPGIVPPPCSGDRAERHLVSFVWHGGRAGNARAPSRVYGVFYTIGIGSGALTPPLFGLLSDARFEIHNIGVFFTVYALALLIARPLFGRLIDRKGFDIAIIPGMLCIGLAMLTLFAAQGLPHFIAAAFLYGIGGGAVAPSLQAMAVIDVPPQRRGAANGTFMSGFDLGIGVGSILCGLVAKLTGYPVMYLLTLLPVTVAFALYFLLARKRDSLFSPDDLPLHADDDVTHGNVRICRRHRSFHDHRQPLTTGHFHGQHRHALHPRHLKYTR